jgi:hypothetical protein
MTLPENAYCTLAEVRERLSLTSTAGDTMLKQIITSVSRWIDDYTWRRFYAATETRYYTADESDQIFIDDIIAVSSLKTDDNADRTYETTWSATDYDLLPVNAALNGAPYSMISITPNGSYGFPSGVKKGVQLVGSFGYCTTTSSGKATIIKEACLLQSERIYKRKDSPMGVAGVTALGVQTLKVPGLDPDVQMMLDPFRRLV